MFTKRNIVKAVKDYIVMTVVANATSVAINTVVDEPTENQETGIWAASALTGVVVAQVTRKRTDRMIDSIADWRKNRKVEETPLPA